MTHAVLGVSLSWWRQAPALRFLAMFLVAWVGLRAMFPLIPALWSDDVDARPVVVVVQDVGPMDAAPWADGPAEGLVHPAPIAAVGGRSMGVRDAARGLPQGRTGGLAGPVDGARDPVPPRPMTIVAWPTMTSQGEPSAAVPSTIITAPPAHILPRDAERRADAASARLSASTWVFLRDDLARRSPSLPVAGDLGGSQAGVRLAYDLGGRTAWQAYGRASVALGHVAQSEAAIGISAVPVDDLPIRLAAERRQKLGRDGRSAMAVMAVGGISGQSLPAHFRLDIYGQAGVVGVHSRDAFVDGAVVVDRAVNGRAEAGSLRLGVMAAGAAQPDVSRLDIGPRITLPVPNVGKGLRLSLDWRHRVAGNAQPKNGAALTMGADF